MAQNNSRTQEIHLPGEICGDSDENVDHLGADQETTQTKNESLTMTANSSNNNDQMGTDNPAYVPDDKDWTGRDTETMYSRQSDTVKNRSNGSNHSNSITPVEKKGYVEMDYGVVKTNGNIKKKESFNEKCDHESLKSASMDFTDIAKIVGKLAVCLLCGMVMGLSLEKGRVFEPRSIRCQFTYQLWIMMKMFLSAVATGLLCLATLSVLPFTKNAFENARIEYLGCLTTKGVLMASIGGALLGAGMALSGACPGMVLAQVGAWVGNGSGLVTFIGCLAGAFTYGVLHPFISKYLGRTSPYQKQLADDWISKVPFAVFSLSFAIFMAAIVTGLELWKPWRTEILPSPAIGFTSTWFMTDYAWPPYVAGILIGSLQLPLVLVVRDTIGGSGSYCTISSQVLVTKRMERAIPYLANFKRGVSSWWQVFFVSGVILGAMTSSLSSHTAAKVDGVGWAMSFVGGFIMLFGARLGGGCTSGHGLSGVGVLALVSFVAVAAMFAGGTVVGLIGWGMDKADVIESFCPLAGTNVVT
ncbi:thiosulfate transporter TsuA-like isoform X2 [Apostichopus japonicus]|uniref:thiosulfate transporter TsuA-like isoform X2 n=1 Tax=Stichopus japonicus TaxID=307972 RepID=UPI003AB36ECD